MYLLKFLYVGKQIGRYQERLVCPLKQTMSSTHCRANKTDEAVVAQLRPQNPVEENVSASVRMGINNIFGFDTFIFGNN